MTLNNAKTTPTQARFPGRHYEQSMGLWIDEPLLREPVLIDDAVDQLADAGYEIIRLFLRNSNYTHRSPEVVQAIARAVQRIHDRGMRAALDCEPHSGQVTPDMGREYPGAMAGRLVSATARVVDGHWLLRVEQPTAGSIFEGVEATFLRTEMGLEKISLDWKMYRESQAYRNGNIHRELFYAEQVPNGFHRSFVLHGSLPEVSSGTLIVYVRFADNKLVDFWAEGFQRYYDALLECYRDIPLDGVGWDEPACDCDWGSYRYGSAFAVAFQRLNGYSLADKLYLLDEPGMSAEAARVRLDYYRTLNEGVAYAQANMIAKAHTLFGENLLLGSHHTWQGEGGTNDYRSGAVDYFRLNDNMDAGYTDCCWWDPASVAYAYTLGSSMGRLTTSGEAEVNTWHYKPTVSNVRRNVNLMTLMNITWFNIWFGRDCDCIMQQGHYTWSTTVAAMQRHRDFQRRIGKRKPVIDVAIWHGWEGVCAWNRPGLANAQKTFCLNTSQLFIKRNIASDFIDSRLLSDSQIEDGRLVNALGSYRVLIIPYALVLPRKAFDACAAFARAGGRVSFVGTPVSADEYGHSLADVFADLLDMPPMTADHYMAGLDAVCTLPDFRRQRLEVCRPLPAGLPRGLISCEGERHGVVSLDGNAVFLTDLDPQQRLIERIENALTPDLQVYGDNLLVRLYRSEDGDVLVAVAGEDLPMRGIMRWGMMSIEVTGGSLGLFEIHDGKLVMNGDATWNLLNI